jgi:hypothetical protein
MNTTKFRPELASHPENVKKLSELSKILKPEIAKGSFQNMKAALMSTYSNGKENVEFKSARQWKEEGFTVKAKAKAYLFWGKPTMSTGADGNQKKFFPVIYLYSNNQVSKSKEEIPAVEVSQANETAKDPYPNSNFKRRRREAGIPEPERPKEAELFSNPFEEAPF